MNMISPGYPAPRLAFSRKDALDLTQSLVISGVIGSGKTTGSSAYAIKSLFQSGAGGICLIAHPEEVGRLLAYAKETHRLDDVILFARDHHRFNPFAWGQRVGLPVENLVAMFTQMAEIAGRSHRETGGEQAIWRSYLEALSRGAFSLLILAGHPLSLTAVSQLISSAPGPGDPERASWRKTSFCWQLITTARQRQANHPDLGTVEDYFLRYWANLSPRTKSSIETTFSGIASPLSYQPLQQMFSTDTTIDPAITHQGKIIILDLPTEYFGEAALYAQSLFKYCWQLATKRRRLRSQSDRLAFCIADEFALFSTASDAEFLSTCRNHRAMMLAVIHGLPELASALGQTGAKALLSQFRTKIFHACGDEETSLYAAKLIGETFQARTFTTEMLGESVPGRFNALWAKVVRRFGVRYNVQFTTSTRHTDRYSYQVSPAEFSRLRTGGAANDFLIDAIVFQSGKIWESGKNYLPITLKQQIPAASGLRSLLALPWRRSKPLQITAQEP